MVVALLFVAGATPAAMNEVSDDEQSDSSRHINLQSLQSLINIEELLEELRNSAAHISAADKLELASTIVEALSEISNQRSLSLAQDGINSTSTNSSIIGNSTHTSPI